MSALMANAKSYLNTNLTRSIRFFFSYAFEDLGAEIQNIIALCEEL